MALTKHAVVLSTELPVSLPTGDRTTRAMTFDAPYSPFFPPTPAHSLLDASKPRSRTRGYSMARPSPSEFESHVTFAPHDPSNPPRSILKRSQSSRNYKSTRNLNFTSSNEIGGIPRATRKPSSRNFAAPSREYSSSRSLTRQLTSNALASPREAQLGKYTSNRDLLSRESKQDNKKFTSSRNFVSARDLGLGVMFTSTRNFKYEEDDGGIKIEMEDLSTDDDSTIASPTPLVPDLGIESDISSSGEVIIAPEVDATEWDESVRAQLGEVDVKKVSLWELLKLKHSWISVWTTHRTSRITCVEHLTIITCMVLTTIIFILN